MDELTMTAFLIPQKPAIVPEHLQQVTDLHDFAPVRLFFSSSRSSVYTRAIRFLVPQK